MGDIEQLRAWISHELEAECDKTFDELAGMTPTGVEPFSGNDTITHLDFEVKEQS